MSAWNGRDSPGLLKMEAGICLVQKLSKKESFCTGQMSRLNYKKS